MRPLLALALFLAVSAMGAGMAVAGTYQVSACAAPAPTVNNSWQPFDNDPTYLEASANCGVPEITGLSPATSGLAAADVRGLSTNVPAGAFAGWETTAPAGDEIGAISMDRDLYEQGEGWVPEVIDAEGNLLPGETCTFSVSGSLPGCEVSGFSEHNGLETTRLAIELLCEPEPFQLTVCGNGSSLHDARVELNSATVTITDDQPPQLVSTSGALFAGGLARGTLSGTIDGADNSGVQFARLYVDGAPVSQQSLACNFTLPAPCPASSSNLFTLNTQTLANGPHQIQAAVIDAAGNQTLGSPVQVTVENSAPSAPSSLQVDGRPSGAWINQPATLTWTNPTRPQGDPIGQVNWIACPGTDTSIPTSGCDALHTQATPLTSLTFDPAQDSAFAGQPQALYTVFVWLSDAIGNASQTNAAAISFGYQTIPPPPPRSITASGRGPYTVTLVAPAHLAPITATDWIACNSARTCTSAQSSPGLSFQFDAAHIPQFQRDPHSSYTIRAWLTDAAGNADPADSAALALSYGSPAKNSPVLRILGVTRRGRALHVHGAAARTLLGHLTIVVHYTLHARAGTAQKTVGVARGKWSASIVLPAEAPTVRVTVVHRSSTHFSAQVVTRQVHHLHLAGRH
jgi:hypothetical protein